jgi:hypothetical protein
MNGVRHRLPCTSLRCNAPSAFRTTMDGVGGARTANAPRLRAVTDPRPAHGRAISPLSPSFG